MVFATIFLREFIGNERIKSVFDLVDVVVMLLNAFILNTKNRFISVLSIDYSIEYGINGSPPKTRLRFTNIHIVH